MLSSNRATSRCMKYHHMQRCLQKSRHTRIDASSALSILCRFASLSRASACKERMISSPESPQRGKRADQHRQRKMRLMAAMLLLTS